MTDITGRYHVSPAA